MHMDAGRAQQGRMSRFFSVVIRTLFVTLLFTLIGMGTGLFAGIIGVVVLAFVKDVHPDMQTAYLRVAIPTAIIFGTVALIYNVVQEIRRAGHRQ
jgi:uncharacterized BrkB/YihY/UPF0761 family membrane protein